MRTVLIGSDFTYDSDGNLVPIEINTNVGMDKFKIEDDNVVFNLSALSKFILDNKFTKVAYIGSLSMFNDRLKELCLSINLVYEFYLVIHGKGVPYVEDSEECLIIRSAFDRTAIVDEGYCRDKINFLNLIKTSPFAPQYAYIDENRGLISNITTIKNNGNHPNFILKSIYPGYNKKIYPKFFKVSNHDELNVVLKNVREGYFLMEYYYNPNKLYENHIKTIRSYNLLFPPNLNSIPVGQYSKISRRNVDELSSFDADTFELSPLDKNKYFTASGGIQRPKLLDTDMVEMSDGTFKSAIDLNVNDIVKTIIIPNPQNTNITNPCNNFGIDYETFVSGTTYSANKIIGKQRVDTFAKYVKLTFTDNTTWEDTSTSSYLILRNDEVRFGVLGYESTTNDCGLKIGDQVILISSVNNELLTILKEVVSIVVTKIIFGGWEITVEEEHLFLTKAEDSDSSFVAIEHNENCTYPPCAQSDCATKGDTCCPDGQCYTNPGSCCA